MHTIDEVLERMDAIVAECRAGDSRAAYFAVLYRRVTRRIKEGIERGEFEDNARMERLDVLFALRYFEAYDAYRQGLPLTQCWQVALQTADTSSPVILQHLLLGINAHINLDLGIAAVQTAGQQALEGLQSDFDGINRILAELVDGVKAKLGKASPAFGWLMPIARQFDEKLVNFSIGVAREGAWRFACKLHVHPNPSQLIAERDQQIARLAQALAHPRGRMVAFILWLIRLFEWQTPTQIAGVLEEI